VNEHDFAISTQLGRFLENAEGKGPPACSREKKQQRRGKVGENVTRHGTSTTKDDPLGELEKREENKPHCVTKAATEKKRTV